MMKLVLYKFEKKENSTKIPTEAVESIETDYVLKTSVSITTPIIVINGDFISISAFNYCSILNFYYFVSDIRCVTNSTLELALQLDVLGSYREAILNSTFFVKFSASNFNSMVIDDRYIKSESNKYYSQSTEFPHIDKQIGNFALTVINDQSAFNQGGFSTSYLLTPSAIRNLAKEFMQNNLRDAFEDKFNNPYQAVISCKWLPFDTTIYNQAIVTPVIGTIPFDTIPAQLITDNKYTYHTQLTILWQYNDFRRCQDWTTVELYLPAIGLVTLPNSVIINSDKIDITISYDLFVGDIVYTLSTGFSNKPLNVFATYKTNVSADISLGQITETRDTGSIIYNAIRRVVHSSILNGNRNTDAVEYSSTGSISGRIGLLSNKDITLSTRTIETQNSIIQTSLGRICGKELQLKTLTGYCECENASIELNCLSSIKESINTYLNGGIYVE